MTDALARLRKDLRLIANKEKSRDLQRFFKTGAGEYAEGDKFLGVMVPQQRALVKKYVAEISIGQARQLLRSRYHEERLLALLILVKKFEKGDDKIKKEIFDLYLANAEFINNWDLVDLSAPRIVGAYLYDKDKSILIELAKSKCLWERRISILATFWFIGKGESRFVLQIAEIMVNDKHDLIHKACGWMLREVGKRCGQDIEEVFLEKHHKTMPRTMLRYAIERFSEEKRRYYMA